MKDEIKNIEQNISGITSGEQPTKDEVKETAAEAPLKQSRVVSGSRRAMSDKKIELSTGKKRVKISKDKLIGDDSLEEQPTQDELKETALEAPIKQPRVVSGSRRTMFDKKIEISTGKKRVKISRDKFIGDDSLMASAQDIEQDIPSEPILNSEPNGQINLSELRAMPIQELFTLVDAAGVEKSNNKAYKKQDLIMLLMREAVRSGSEVIGGGVLEVRNDGSAFARSSDASYLNCRTDFFVPQGFVRKFQLKTGDTLHGILRTPKEGERYFALAKLLQVNFEAPETSLKRIDFDDLVAIFPTEPLTLESGSGTSQDITARIIDLVAPIGFGQRAMIVSPPKAGKTMMLQNIAHAITSNHPNCKLMVLLIDERPEEVTDMARSVRGEVIASTFDESPARHVQVAEMVIEKAKRLVEYKHDVVILLDSMTRLARAYNSVAPSSGKVLTGGVEANALQKPKRFFGSARNIEGGGSLTIIATALVETGSKMEEVIYEEFKGTGNMEVHLSRFIAQKRIWPAINIPLSGTRRDDLFLDAANLNRIDILRRHLQTLEDVKSIEFLIEKLRNSKTNKEFFDAMRNG